jgi:hypothetical protein
MKSKLAMLVLAVVSLRCPLLAEEDQHVNISGKVTSAVDHTPLDKVKILAEVKHEKVPDPLAITDGNGHYKASVPPGEILLFIASGYRAARRPVQTASTAMNLDQELYPNSRVSQAYWEEMAKEVAVRDPEAIRDFWSDLELKQVNAVEKVEFAQALLNVNPELAKQLPEVKTFADADTTALAEVSQNLGEWLQDTSNSRYELFNELLSGKLPTPVTANVISEQMAKVPNDHLITLFGKVTVTIAAKNPDLASWAAAGAATRIVTNEVASGKPEAVQKGVRWLQEGNRAKDVFSMTGDELRSDWGSVKQIQDSIGWVPAGGVFK